MQYEKRFTKIKKSGLALLLFFIFLLIFYNINLIINNHHTYANQEIPKVSNNVAYEWENIWSIMESPSPNDLVLDNSGNIYVTGSNNNYYLTGHDYFLMKIDSSGTLNWSCIWGSEYYDFGYALELFDSFIYILGSSNNSYEILKLNKDGIIEDVMYLNEQVSFFSQGMEMDQFGNFYLLGINKSQDHDFYITKLNLTGVSEWELTWDSGIEVWGASLTLDGDNNIYIVGKSYNTLVLLKYTNSGNLLWSSTEDFNDYFSIKKIVVDQSGNIFIVGDKLQDSRTQDYDIFLLKYSSLGVLQWNFSWGGNSYDYSKDLVIDFTGNIYLLGDTNSYGHGKTDICLLKLDTEGNLIWTYFWGGSNYDDGEAIAIDFYENIYVVGVTRSFGSAYSNLCLIKFGVDSDEDGLSDNNEENVYLTDKYNSDTDNDGINDGDEINIYDTNPLNKDSDSDLFSDYEEIFIFLTNPNNSFNNPLAFALIYSLVGVTGVLIALYIHISIKERREKEKRI